ncbi:MAG TPA: hypothetical protein VK435_05220 [Thermodesulfovibrionales bacterium]|nr:hypothetical protein [Thermodesulfovibrionales bacterium]
MKAKEEKEIKKSDIEFLEGEFINVIQSTARSVDGGHVNLQQVGALSIDGERIEASQCASGVLTGGDVDLNQCICTISAADNLSINSSLSGIAISRDEVAASKSAVGLMAARKIKSENTSAFLVIGGEIEGNMTTLLDWKSALSLGAVLGGIWGFFTLLTRRK